MDKKKTLLAFIRISGGSSWYQSEDNEPLELMALKAAKQAKQDWKHLFKFKKDGEWIISIYDVSKCSNGWVAQSFPSGIFPVLKNGKLGKKPCKFIKSIKLFY
tara:strand:+ start:392 stop:700 length:309 start_codon:yes stop_codon:yes gene_type:complete